MTITINTTTIARSVIIFAAGVVASNKVKKLVNRAITKATNKLSDKANAIINNKTTNIKNDILKKMHKAIDNTFEDTIDVPIK
jgi:hypothetical protein